MPTDTKSYNLGDGTRTTLLFGEWLVEWSLISDEQLARLAEQNAAANDWVEYWCSKSASRRASSPSVVGALSVEHLAADDLSVIDKEIARQVPENIAKRFGLIAIGRRATRRLSQ